MANRFVQGVDFHEIPMENEALLSIFRRVRRYPGVAVFSEARLIVFVFFARARYARARSRIAKNTGVQALKSRKIQVCRD